MFWTILGGSARSSVQSKVYCTVLQLPGEILLKAAGSRQLEAARGELYTIQKLTTVKRQVIDGSSDVNLHSVGEDQ